MSERFRTLREIGRAWVWGFKENVRFAGTALVSHKLRSALTTLGIIIGVMTVIAMVSVIEGFNRNVIAEFETFGSTLVQFQKFDVQFGPGGNRDEEQFRRPELTVEDAMALKRLVPAMAAVSPERYWFAGGFGDDRPAPNVIYEGEEAIPDLIVGVTEDYPQANNTFVGEGRFISATDVSRNAEVTVVGAAVADTLFPFSDPIGKVVTIGGRRYEIVGVMEQQGNSFFESTDSHVYMPISTFDSHFPWVKRRTGVNIATVPHRPEWVDLIKEEGTAVLRARRKVPFNKPNNFGIRTNDQFIQNFRQITGGITLAMIFVSSIALLVGGVGVMNIMLVSVTERTREIGVRKAMGAMRRDIVIQFLTEAMTLSAIGGIIGIIVGFGISRVVGKLSPLATTVPMWSVAVGLIVSLSIGLFFGIYPAWKAAKLDPIESLRYE
jgi:putative ABC transport system permease protein